MLNWWPVAVPDGYMTDPNGSLGCGQSRIFCVNHGPVIPLCTPVVVVTFQNRKSHSRSVTGGLCAIPEFLMTDSSSASQ